MNDNDMTKTSQTLPSPNDDDGKFLEREAAVVDRETGLEDPKITASSTSPPPSSPEERSRCWKWLVDFYVQNEFLILVIAAILVARAYPPLGADYLQPQITATWLAVCIIFFMAGLGLKTEEFSKALQQVYFNLFVQAFNFGVVSFLTYLVSMGLQSANILSDDLADGMVVCASLPMTINMVLVLTKASGGDESLAIVNAAAGNLLGVFLSPVLILGYLGVTGDINLAEVFYKLALRVVLPVAIGQIVQKTQPTVVDFCKKYKAQLKKFQEYCLVFIVYTVFCKTFEDDEASDDSTIADVFKMIAFLLLLVVGFMVAAWYSLGIFWKHEPEMRIMGLYGCTHKTVAMGVPLIGAIYEDTASVGLYTLPLLIWHPMQLVLGTFLAPRLSRYVEQENIRLGRVHPDDNNNDAAGGGDAQGETDEAAATLLEPQDVENGDVLPKAEPSSELRDEPESQAFQK